MEPMVPSIPEPLVSSLAEYRRRLEELLGDRLVGLRLYGSWARGEQTPDSDVDLVVLTRDRLGFREVDEVRAPAYEIGWRFGEMVSVKLFQVDDFNRMVEREHPFEAIEREGIPA